MEEDERPIELGVPLTTTSGHKQLQPHQHRHRRQHSFIDVRSITPIPPMRGSSIGPVFQTPNGGGGEGGDNNSSESDIELHRHHSHVSASSSYYAPTDIEERRGWTAQLEIYVQRIGQRAGGWKWAHSQANRHFTARFLWIGYLCIFLNALATAGNIPWVATCQSSIDGIKIAAIVVGFLVTLALAFQQFRDYGSRRQRHITAEANYAELYDNISQQMHRSARNRQMAEDYVEWISKESADLKESSPLVPPFILNQYRAMVERSGKPIADPEGIDEILIRRETPPRRFSPPPPSFRHRPSQHRGAKEKEEEEDVRLSIVDHGPPPSIPVSDTSFGGIAAPIPRSGRLVVTYNDDPLSTTGMSARDQEVLNRFYAADTNE